MLAEQRQVRKAREFRVGDLMFHESILDEHPKLGYQIYPHISTTIYKQGDIDMLLPESRDGSTPQANELSHG